MGTQKIFIYGSDGSVYKSTITPLEETSEAEEGELLRDILSGKYSQQPIYGPKNFVLSDTVIILKKEEAKKGKDKK